MGYSAVYTQDVVVVLEEKDPDIAIEIVIVPVRINCS
jgi:hypothetical protein